MSAMSERFPMSVIQPCVATSETLKDNERTGLSYLILILFPAQWLFQKDSK